MVDFHYEPDHSEIGPWRAYLQRMPINPCHKSPKIKLKLTWQYAIKQLPAYPGFVINLLSLVVNCGEDTWDVYATMESQAFYLLALMIMCEKQQVLFSAWLI